MVIQNFVGNSLNKVLEIIEGKVFLPLAVVSVLLMTLLTTFDAAGRYLFNLPIVGAYEITERYLMVMCFYFAISYAYREGANIRITLFLRRLPKGVCLVLYYSIQFMAIFYCGTLFLTALACNISRIGETLLVVNTNIPLWPIYITVPLGLCTLTMRMILDLWQIKNGKSGLFKDEEREEAPVV